VKRHIVMPSIREEGGTTTREPQRVRRGSSSSHRPMLLFVTQFHRLFRKLTRESDG
jgi:hypothetical protein